MPPDNKKEVEERMFKALKAFDRMPKDKEVNIFSLNFRAHHSSAAAVPLPSQDGLMPTSRF